MSSSKDNVTQSTTSEHFIGRVKWFNNKAGYGFITVTDGLKSGTDIFVHHSAINVENQQYKYLVQGEYVEFELVKTTSQAHEWQASRVEGIKGGKLMCETRHELKVARNEYKSSTRHESSSNEQNMPRQKVPKDITTSHVKTSVNSNKRNTQIPKARGEGPRELNNDKNEWTLMTKNGPQKSRGRPQRKETSTNN